MIKAREEVLAKLRDEHAVGVVVAVRGEIVWADLFASTDLLARYWTKLVRSYAAESLTEGENHSAPSVVDAQHFLDMPSGGTENSEGDVGIYRYRELKSGNAETFVLESLLPGTGYDVHISKMKLIEEAPRCPQAAPDGSTASDLRTAELPPRFLLPGCRPLTGVTLSAAHALRAARR